VTKSDHAARARILVAEDDPSMRDLLARILTDAGHEVFTAEDGLAAIARLKDPLDVVITDIRMPGADGTQVLAHARRRAPDLPVVVLTAFGSIPGAVDAMRLGAFDYLTKPLPDPQTLRDVVERALAGRPPGATRSVIAEDPAMQQVVETARRVAQADSSVLLLGDSGTGKEVIARLIHDTSPRQDAPFVAVNCAALAETLLESELFGHEKGAFTGAQSRHEGKFEQADKGTLFLDEVGEMSPALQAKLLRVLQERSFQRVGGEAAISVDVRVVAATNRDLEQMVKEGQFREDLYYRLAVLPILIPPLRDRPKDVIPLAEHFIQLLGRGRAERSQPELTSSARKALAAHDWPGNVRELQNVLERSLVLSGGGPVDAENLQLGASPTPRGEGTLKDMERRAIQDALAAEDGNRRKAAKRLGIALRTLQYKIKQYGLS
jgi:DNA-binding NtrC family response regulator